MSYLLKKNKTWEKVSKIKQIDDIYLLNISSDKRKGFYAAVDESIFERTYDDYLDMSVNIVTTVYSNSPGGEGSLDNEINIEFKLDTFNKIYSIIPEICILVRSPFVIEKFLSESIPFEYEVYISLIRREKSYDKEYCICADFEYFYEIMKDFHLDNELWISTKSDVVYVLGKNNWERFTVDISESSYREEQFLNRLFKFCKKNAIRYIFYPINMIESYIRLKPYELDAIFHIKEIKIIVFYSDEKEDYNFAYELDSNGNLLVEHKIEFLIAMGQELSILYHIGFLSELIQVNSLTMEISMYGELFSIDIIKEDILEVSPIDIIRKLAALFNK